MSLRDETPETFVLVGLVDGEETLVAVLGEGCATAEPHVFELAEAALERRGHAPDALEADPGLLREVLVEDVFEAVLEER